VPRHAQAAAADPVRIKATVMAIPYNHAPANQVLRLVTPRSESLGSFP
jgi:hypothetical protein